MNQQLYKRIMVKKSLAKFVDESKIKSTKTKHNNW